ncbi:MAG: hypothetical protein BIFFINMI_03915 [Phycisphaerae bacterium]|nr:hypothetical protein [Phycisphaerae bacterium]
MPLHRFDIHGVTLDLVGLPAALLPEVDRWLGWARNASAGEGNAGPRGGGVIDLSGRRALSPAELDDFRRGELFFHHTRSNQPLIYGRFDVVGYRRAGGDGEQALLDYGCHGHVWIDFPSRRIGGLVADGEQLDGRLGMIFFVDLPVCWTLSSLGLFPTHAAGVRVDGRCWLLAASSGCGKTTVAAALAEAGGEFLGDDWVLLGREDGRIVAHGFPSRVGLRPPSMRWLPGLAPLCEGGPVAAEGPGADGRFKYSLDPLRAWPGRVLSAADVDGVLLPRIAGEGPTRFEPATRTEALNALMEQNLSLINPASAEAHFQVLADLVAQAEVRRLVLGDGPLGVAEALRR